MVLFINACMRENSRTEKLAYCLLSELTEHAKEIKLCDDELPALDSESIVSRTEAAQNNDMSDPFVSLATDFRKADKIVIAAPYWDLSFPAVLKKYLEAIMVEGITFEYDENGKPLGLCIADALYYVTTCGGRIVEPDCGYTYIKNLSKKLLGIKNTCCFYAEGLDMVGADVDEILEHKMTEIKKALGRSTPTSNSIRNIMVVDDSKINIIKAEYILKKHGFRIFAEESGKACLTALAIQKIDLILLDIEMPDMDGFEVLDAIRANPEWSNIPVIFVTSDKSMDIVLKASQSGISGYVVKPFTEDELMSKINKLYLS